ncbi:MAG: V-type ATPase subunit [Actinomycetota bacterium]
MSMKDSAGLNPIKAGASSHFREGRTKGLPDFLKVDLRRIKPFHDTTRYGYAVGRIRALEMQMLNTQRMDRLVDADLEDALNILEEMDIGAYLAGARLARDIDAGLTAFLRQVYATLEESLPGDSAIMDFFLCRYDFHNLKALLKAKLGEGAPQGLLEGLGTVGLEALQRGLEDPALLPSPYKEAMEEALEQPSPQQLDTLLESHYLSYRLFLARREGSPFVIDYARASIDLSNLKLVIRARLLSKDREFLEKTIVKGGFVPASDLLDLYSDPPEVMAKKLEANTYYSQLIEIAESPDKLVRLTDFDRRSDDLLMDLVRGMKRVSVGVEPIFAYLRARENEVLIVRMILVAKLHNISPDTLERTLRKLYIE